MEHSELLGATSQFRYRPERLAAQGFEQSPTCSFRRAGVEYQDVPVVDVSMAGAGLRPEEPIGIYPGEELEEFRLVQAGQVVWSGRAEFIYERRKPVPRVGVHFTGPLLDLDEMRFREFVIEQRLRRGLDSIQQWEQILPAEWRAKVASLHEVLVTARVTLDEVERSDEAGDWKKPERSLRICEAFSARWGPEFRRLVRELDRMTPALQRENYEAAQEFGERMIMRELAHCPLHRRIHDKPLGYAGDFRMMEILQARELEGDSLYERFMHYVLREYSLSHTVRARGAYAREAAAEAIAASGPTKILSVACGPAIELAQLLREVEAIPDRLDVLLLDQDTNALQRAYERLSRALGTRRERTDVHLHCLHFGLRQLVAPKGQAEQQLAEEVIRDSDLVYTMGLFDYLSQSVAQRSVRRMYDLACRGGRVLVGNLKRVPDSTWIMDFALDWPLEYRDVHSMRDLATGLEPLPAEQKVVSDATGHCLFLDVRKP